MEGESTQKSNAPDERLNREERAEEKPHPGVRNGKQRIWRWPVWLILILIVLLLASSIANLVVSQRAYESSRKQVTVIEQLTQSIKDIQRSILNLSKMLEQAPPEDEEPEEERGVPFGDGSI